jgi:hypothetical protein
MIPLSTGILRCFHTLKQFPKLEVRSCVEVNVSETAGLEVTQGGYKSRQALLISGHKVFL